MKKLQSWVMYDIFASVLSERSEMRRSDLQGLAESKLRDSILLFEHRRWSNAYYLAGYSVELGLKACIARQISAETIPDRAILKDLFSHEFQKLIGLSGLKAELEGKKKMSSQFGANWAITLEWNPDVRYQSRTAIEAQYLLEAISEENDGVLPWIRQHW